MAPECPFLSLFFKVYCRALIGENLINSNMVFCSHMSNLLELEDVFVEVLLELFISIVDAKLLKGVLPEDFKTKDVQHTN